MKKEKPSKDKRPRDINQLAKLIVDISTGEVEDTISESKKNQAAVSLGRLGGLKGGKARAKKLTAKRRREIAQKAAQTRWAKHNNPIKEDRDER